MKNIKRRCHSKHKTYIKDLFFYQAHQLKFLNCEVYQSNERLEPTVNSTIGRVRKRKKTLGIEKANKSLCIYNALTGTKVFSALNGRLLRVSPIRWTHHRASWRYFL